MSVGRMGLGRGEARGVAKLCGGRVGVGQLHGPGCLPPPPLVAAPSSSSSAATTATHAAADATHRLTSQGKALCKRKIKAGNEFVEQDMSTMQAVDGRDALSKAIYSRLFDRLISQIDSALAMGMEACRVRQLAPDSTWHREESEGGREGGRWLEA